MEEGKLLGVLQGHVTQWTRESCGLTTKSPRQPSWLRLVTWPKPFPRNQSRTNISFSTLWVENLILPWTIH